MIVYSNCCTVFRYLIRLKSSIRTRLLHFPTIYQEISCFHNVTWFKEVLNIDKRNTAAIK